ncbi:LysM peptidoglycan-binding domain-containing protein [Hahella sp. NBU794]|uniref:golvesin C-terminal-like domain-containing protein n=1 Tax=Hahella sp. NBU794 TaxID=3422590 RepID=UPI003D700FC1
MVAVVSGEGLGLFGASLSGAGAGLSQAGVGQGGERVYVNAATGNLVLQRRDELLLGAGRDASLIRTYNSQGRFTDDNGDNFYFSFNHRLEFNGGTLNKAGSVITRIAGDGSRTDYRYDESRGLYVSSVGEGAHDTLEFRGGTGADAFLWTEGESGAQEVYSWQGKLSALAHRDEPGRVTISRSAAATTLTTASGEKLEIQYDGSGRAVLVKTVGADGAQRNQTYYGYDAQGRLTTVTVDLTPADNSIGDGRTFVTRYSYDGDSKRVAKMQASDGVSVSFQYQNIGGEYRVTRVTQGDGADAIVTAYAYDLAQRTATVTRVLDPATLSGLQTVLRYDERARLVELRLPQQDGAQSVRRYAYDADDNLIQSTDADGYSETYRYDAMGNLLTHTDRLGGATDYTYNAYNQTLTETTDGATQRYVYDSEHRLRYRVDAEGGVTEFRYNNQGQLTATQGYLARYDLSDLSPNQPLSEGSLNTWAPGARAQGTTLTEYDYDFRGQLSRQTRYSKTDATGAGIGAATTHFIYDAEGRLLKQVNPDQAAPTENASAAPESLGHRTGETLYVYDGLGRLLSVKDALGAVTTQTEYQGATILSRDAAGLQSVKTYNSAGALIDVVERDAGGVQLGKAQQYYDAQGRVIRSVDAQGAQTRYVYDGQDRVRFEIDALGYVTENRYDALGRVTQARRYETAYGGAVSLAALETFAGGQSAITTRRFYDAEGQVRFDIDAQGYVTGYEYDGQGRVAKKTRYDKAADLNAANLASLAAHAPSWRGDGVVQIDAGRIIKTAATGLSGGRAVANEALQQGRGALEFTVAALPTGASLGAVGFNKNPETVLTGNDYLNEVDLGVFIRDPDGAGSQGHSLMIQVNGVRTEPTSATPIQVGDRLRIEMRGADARILLQRSGQHGFTLIQTLTGVVDANANYTAQTNLYGAGAAIEAVALSGDADYHSAGVSTRYVYDGKGQVRFEVDAQGFVTENRYDAQGRVVETVRYLDAQALTPAQLAQLQRQADSGALGGVGDVVLDSETLPAPAGWSESTSAAGYEGRQYLTAKGASTAVSWRSALTQAGRHGVYATWTSHANRASNATYRIHHLDAAGKATVTDVTVNQRTQGGQWVLLGDFDFGAEGWVELLGGGDGYVVADAVKFARANYVAQSKRVAYDAQGRARFSLDEQDYVTENRYDAAGRVVATLRYDSAYPGDAWGESDLESFVSGKTPASHSRLVYDAKGQARFTIDALGQVTESRYDALGRVTEKLSYSSAYTGGAFTESALQSFISGKTPASHSRLVYDVKGQVRFTVDALGQVTETRYDSLGRVTEKLSYSHAYTGGVFTESALQTFANGEAPASHFRLVYDARGQVRFEVDALGYVTEFEYDAQGRVVNKSRYAHPVDPASADLASRLPQLLNWGTDAEVSQQGGRLTRTGPASLTAGRAIAGSGLTGGEGVLEFTVDQLVNGQSLGVVGFNLTPEERLSGNDYFKEIDLGVFIRDRDGAAAEKHSVLIQYKGTQIAPATMQFVEAGDRFRIELKDGDARILLQRKGQDNYVLIHTLKDAVDATQTYVAQANLYAQGSAIGDVWMSGDATQNSERSRERVVYDAKGQARFTIDALGQVTESRYDALGRVTEKLSYSSAYTGGAFTESALQSFISGKTPAAHSRLVYDVKGQARFTLDALGLVTENRYDSLGRVTEKLSYSSAYTGDVFTESALQTFANGAIPASHSRLVYDVRGQVRFEVDTLGYVTEFEYDAQGRVVNKSRYEQPIDAATADLASRLPQLLNWGTDAAVSQQGGRLTRTGPASLTAGRVIAGSGLTGGEGVLEFTVDQLVNGQSLGVVGFNLNPEERLSGNDYFKEIDLGVFIRDRDGAAAEKHSVLIQYKGTQIAPATMQFVEAGDRFRIELKDGDARILLQRKGQDNYVLIHTLKDAVDATQTYVAQANLYAQGSAIGDVWMSGTATQNSERSHERLVYNAKGQARFTIDALGYVTENRYDALGQVAEKLSYDRAYAGPDYSEAALTQFASAQSQPRSGRLVYDAKGQARFEIDALGHVTEREYDAAGRVIATYQYNGALPANATYTEAGVEQWLPQAAEWSKRTGALVGGSSRIEQLDVPEARDFTGSVRSRQSIRGEGYVEFSLPSEGVNAVFCGLSEKDGGTTYEDLNFAFYRKQGGVVRCYEDSTKVKELGVLPGDTRYRIELKNGKVSYYIKREADAGFTLVYASAKAADPSKAYAIDSSFYKGGSLLKDVVIGTRLDAPAGRVNVSRTIYDARGLARFSLNALGQVTETRYDAAGRATQTLRYETAYSGADYSEAALAQFVAGETRAQHAYMVYDSLGQARFKLDHQGHITELEYDHNGQVTRTLSYVAAYDLSQPLTAAALETYVQGHASAGDRVEQVFYDARGLEIYRIDAGGRLIEQEYDHAGRLTHRVRYAASLNLGTAATLTHVTQAADAHRSAAANQHSRRVYDALGRLRYSLDGENYVSETLYNGQGQVTEERRYAAPWTQAATLSALSGLHPDAETRITRYAYDDAGRKISQSQRLMTGGAETWITESYAYDAHGNRTAVTDARGNVTTFAYDADNRLIAKLTPKDSIDDADISASARKGAVTRYQYDGFDNLIQESQYITEVSIHERTAADYATANVPANNDPVSGDRHTRYEYDALNRQERIRTPELNGVSTLTRKEYDRYGNVIALIEAEGSALERTTRYEFDDLNRVVKETKAFGTADASSTGYVYDAFNQVERVIDPRAYEILDSQSDWAKGERERLRLLAENYQANPAGLWQSQQAQWLKDNALLLSFLSREHLPEGEHRALLLQIYSKSQTFDARGLKTSETNGEGYTTYTQYDAFGNIISVTDPSGATGYFFYDALNRQTLQVSAGGAAKDFTYNAAGQVVAQRSWANRINAAFLAGKTEAQARAMLTADAAHDQFTRSDFDSLGRLTTQTAQATSGQQVVESYGYDAQGNRISWTDRGGHVYAYRYDAQGRLLETIKPSVRVTFNADASLTGERRLSDRNSYDALGNRIRVVEGGYRDADGSYKTISGQTRATEYVYDKLNREVQVWSDLIDISFANDAGEIRRYNRVRQATQREYDALGNQLKETVQAFQVDGANRPTTAVGAQRTQLFEYDNLSRVTAAVDAAGAVTAYDYDPSGNRILERRYGEALSNPGNAALAALLSKDTDDYRELRYTFDLNNRQVETRTRGETHFDLALSNQQLAALTQGESAVSKGFYSSAYSQEEVVTQTLYNRNGDVIAERDGRGGVTRHFYTAQGDLQATLAAGVTDYQRDGGAVTVTRHHALTQWTTDALGQIREQVQYAYEAKNPAETATLAELLANVAAQRAAAESDAAKLAGRDLADLSDEEVAQKLVRGDRRQTYDYDRLGRRITETVHGVEDYQFVNGAPKKTTASSRSTRYDYDNLNRLQRTIAPGEGAETLRTLETTYDALGRKTTEKGQSFTDYKGRMARATVTYGYDALGRQVTQTRVALEAGANQTSRTLVNALGFAVADIDASGARTDYATDAFGAVAEKSWSQRQAEGGSQSYWNRYWYDGAGREIKRVDTTGLSHETRYNGYGDITAKGMNGQFQEQFKYDRLGRLFSTNKETGAPQLYLYDKNGNASAEFILVDDLKDASGNPIDLATLTSPEQVKALGVLQTQMKVSVYDERNRHTDTFEAPHDYSQLSASLTEEEVDKNWSSTVDFEEYRQRLLGTQAPQPGLTAWEDVKEETTVEYNEKNVGYYSSAPGTSSSTTPIGFDGFDLTQVESALALQYELTKVGKGLSDVALSNATNSYDSAWQAESVEKDPANENRYIKTTVRIWRAAEPVGATHNYYIYRDVQTQEFTFKPELELDAEALSSLKIEEKENSYHVLISYERGGTVTVTAPMKTTHDTKRVRLERSVVDESVKTGGNIDTIRAIGTKYISVKSDVKVARTYGNYGQSYISSWNCNLTVDIPSELKDMNSDLRVVLYDGSNREIGLRYVRSISDTATFKHSGANNSSNRSVGYQNLVLRIYSEKLGNIKIFEKNVSYDPSKGNSVGEVKGKTLAGFVIVDDANHAAVIKGNVSRPGDESLPEKATVIIDAKENVWGSDYHYGSAQKISWNNLYSIKIPPELQKLNVPLLVTLHGEGGGVKTVPSGTSMVTFNHSGSLSAGGGVKQSARFTIDIPSKNNLNVFDGKYTFDLYQGVRNGRVSVDTLVGASNLESRATKVGGSFILPIGEGLYQIYYETQSSEGGAHNKARASINIGAGAASVSGQEYEFTYIHRKLKKVHTESAKAVSTKNIGGSWKLESPEQRNVIQNYRVSWLLGEQSSYQIHRSQRYNAFGEIVKEVDGNGNATHMAYDAQGRLTYKVDPKVAVYQDHGPESASDSNSSLKSLNAHPVTKYYYDGQNNLVASQDANSYLHQQKSGYSNEWKGDTAFYRGQEYAAGQVASEVDAMGAKKTYKYDQLGNKRLMIDELGRYHSFIYDKANRLQEVRQFSSLSNYLQGSSYSSERYSYDEAGNRITHTNAANFQQKYFYDGEGRITKHISFDDGDISNNSAKWERRETYYKYSYDAEIGGIGGFRKTTENGLNTETNANYRTNHLLTDDVDYFGKIRYHKDLGGHEFYYEYNQAGWLTKQTSNTAFNYSDSIIPTDTGIADRVRQRKSQKIEYKYYANGSLHQVLDEGAKSFTEFRYDANGNVVGETYRSKPFSDLAGGLENDTLPYQNVTAKYDALNRVYEIDDYDYKLNYFYDAVGNRRRVKAEYDNAAISSDKYGENKLTQDFFYLYDKENRFLVTMGALNQAANGVRTIGAGNTGYSIKYDAMGRRLSSDSAQLSENSGSPQEVRQKYGYDERGNLETIWLYDEKFKDATGANFDGGYVLISRRENIDPLGRTKKKTEYKYEKYNGNVQTFKVSEESYDYNADNRLLESKITVADSRAVDRSIKYHYLNDGQTLRQTEFKGSGDDANSVTDYFYDSQDRWDTYKESKVTITATKSGVDNWKPGTSYYAYDANGHNLFVYDHAADRSLSYVNNHNGQILFRDEVDWEEKGGKAPVRRKFFYLNGIVRGDMGSDDVPSRTDYVQHLANMPDTEHVVGQEQVTIPVGKEGHFTFNRDVKRKIGYSNLKRIVPVTSADFDQNFQPINSNYPGKAPTYYRVNSGDTLATIASRLWGDASLWYLIADANGLSGDQDLKADLNLVVPNVVTNIHINASTFRPYDPGLALGDTTPTLPEPPPPPKKGKCAGAAIFVMIIAIAVTAIVAPALAGVVGDALFTAGMTTVTSIGAGGATITTLTAGASAFATAAGAFVGGLAGSAVSQLAAKELDLQDHFSLRSALRGGLTAAATAGISQYMGWGKDISWSATAGKALTAVGANYAAGKLVDQETHFRWRDVAASLATSAIMGGTGLGKTGSILHSGLEAQSWMPSPLSTPLSYSAISGITSGVVSEAVKTAVYDSEDYRPDYVGMIAGVVGSALGDLALIGVSSGGGVKTSNQVSESIKGTDYEFELKALYNGLENIDDPLPSSAFDVLKRPSQLGTTVVIDKGRVIGDEQGGGVLGEVGKFGIGFAKALGSAVYEPLAMVYDIEQVAWNFGKSLLTGNAPEDINYTSAMGQSVAGGAGTGDILLEMAAGIIFAPYTFGYELGTGVITGDGERAGEAFGNLFMMFAGAKRSGVGKVEFKGSGSISSGNQIGSIGDIKSKGGGSGLPSRKSIKEGIETTTSEAVSLLRSEFGKKLVDSVRAKANELIESIDPRHRDKLAAVARVGLPELGIYSEFFTNIKVNKIRNFDGVSMVEGETTLFRITDVDKYMHQVRKRYETAGPESEPLNANAESLIREYIGAAGEKVFSTDFGIPGLHAEVRAANSLFNKLSQQSLVLKEKIQVATVNITSNPVKQGKDFVACQNCSGILPSSIFEILTN